MFLKCHLLGTETPVRNLQGADIWHSAHVYGFSVCACMRRNVVSPFKYVSNKLRPLPTSDTTVEAPEQPPTTRHNRH